MNFRKGHNNTLGAYPIPIIDWRFLFLIIGVFNKHLFKNLLLVNEAFTSWDGLEEEALSLKDVACFL